MDVFSRAILNSTLNLNDDSCFVSNSLNESCRNAPYMDIIVKVNHDDKDYEVYNTYVKNRNNVIVTTDGDQLQIDQESGDYYQLIQINDKRFYMCDQQIWITKDKTSDIPEYLNFHFKNCDAAICTLPNINKIPSIISSPYTESQVTRKSVFTYYPSRPVSFLMDYRNKTKNEYGFAIYIMQSYCKQKLPLTNDQLAQLGSILSNEHATNGNTLPQDVVYAYSILSPSTTLYVVSDSTAYLMNDALNNTYVYLDPKYSSVLYEQQKQLLKLVSSKSVTETESEFKNDRVTIKGHGYSTSKQSGNSPSDAINNSSIASITESQDNAINEIREKLQNLNPCDKIPGIITSTSTTKSILSLK